MKRYSVLQGNMTSTGKGDYTIMKSFESLERARKFMKSIYNDMDGYTRLPHGHLTTIIIDNDMSFDELDYEVDMMIFEYCEVLK